MAVHQPRPRIWRPVARAMLPWVLLYVVGKPLLALSWPPYQWSGSFLRWLSTATNDVASMLPFALFAAGVVVARRLGHSRRAIRAAIAVGILVSAVAYALAGWAAPLLEDRDLASLGSETEDSRRFGPRTPVGIARNIRFVEANPPEEYHLSVSNPHRHPPNALRWQLHVPVAMSVFGLLNVLLGVLSTQLTVDLDRGRRRSARLAIGVLGGSAFFACLVLADPVRPFLLHGTMRSGTVSAWVPLALPLVETFLLAYLVRRRKYG